jgi:hypothetical protein
MKLMKNFLISSSVAILLIFSGCADNENTVSPPPQSKVKITGTVYASLDWTNDEFEKVANKKIILKMYNEDSEQLYRTIETTTDANGNYLFEFDIDNNPKYIYVTVNDFKANVKKDADTTEEVLFVGTRFTHADIESVIKGGEYIRDIYYGE